MVAGREDGSGRHDCDPVIKSPTCGKRTAVDPKFQISRPGGIFPVFLSILNPPASFPV
jgi:hypothetical protein